MPYNEFSFIFKKDNYFYIDDLITSFKNFIGKNILSICEYIKLHKLKSSFCIVIKEETERPAISISHENLLFLCELNANIDFDFI